MSSIRHWRYLDGECRPLESRLGPGSFVTIPLNTYGHHHVVTARASARVVRLDTAQPVATIRPRRNHEVEYIAWARNAPHRSTRPVQVGCCAGSASAPRSCTNSGLAANDTGLRGPAAWSTCHQLSDSQSPQLTRHDSGVTIVLILTLSHPFVRPSCHAESPEAYI